jgi:hypothetical protein
MLPSVAIAKIIVYVCVRTYIICTSMYGCTHKRVRGHMSTLRAPYVTITKIKKRLVARQSTLRINKSQRLHVFVYVSQAETNLSRK